MAPAIVGPKRLMLDWVHIGVLDDMIGVVGAAFMTTLRVAVALVHPPETIYSEYTPDIAAVVPARVGSSTFPGFQPPGPDQT